MSSAYPFGYWTFAGKNGLYGAASTYVTLASGQKMLVKDPDHPAVLEDEFILFAVRNDLNARRQFFQLLPTMDAVSQARLNALVRAHARSFNIDYDSLAQADNIQRKEVVSSVLPRQPKTRQ